MAIILLPIFSSVLSEAMKPISLIARDSGPFLSFDTMKEARKLKAELKKLTESDSAYYGVLARFEIGHFDQIATVALEKGKEPAAYAKEVLKGLQMEINAATWEASEAAPYDPKKKKSKLFLAFTSEGAFEEVRGHLKHLSGDDKFYFDTLRAYGYSSANEIPTHEAGIKVYKALCVERNRIQLDRETVAAAAKQVGPERAKDLMDTFRLAHDTLGAGAFFGVLDKYGCPTIDIAVRSYDLEKILKELKEISDYRNRT